MFEVLLAGLIGLVASFLSNISGGGGSLIVLPSLLAMDVPSKTAIGSVKLGNVGLVLGSAASSRKQEVIRRDYLWPLIITAVFAAILGPLISLRLPDETVKLISSIFILATAASCFMTWRMAAVRQEVSIRSRYVGYAAYFVAITTLSGFGSGVGMLNTYILIGFLGMTPVEAISTRRIVGLVGLPLQLSLFIGSGNVNVPLGLGLLVGSLIGGYAGMHVAIRQGNEFVKRAMAVVSILLVASLFI